MKHRITFTYSTTSPESATNGEHADHGFYNPNGWTYSLNDPEIYKDVMENSSNYDFDGSLSEAIRAAKDLGIAPRSSNDLTQWWSTIDPIVEDYGTGETWEYSLHVEGITPSTVNRINKALAY